MSNGAQGYKNALSSIANDLYWAGISDEKISKVFNSESGRYIGYKSKELGIKDAIEKIGKKRERIAPIEEVSEEFLDTPDVLDGSFTSGWGGVRNSEVIKYIVYEYERYKRGPSGLLSLAPYHEFRKNFQVEHLVPKNAEEGHKLKNHEKNRNRIGNLAVLSAKENQSERNTSFESKYNDIYKKSSLKVLRDLDGPKFSVEDVYRRNDKILNFVTDRWD